MKLKLNSFYCRYVHYIHYNMLTALRRVQSDRNELN